MTPASNLTFVSESLGCPAPVLIVAADVEFETRKTTMGVAPTPAVPHLYSCTFLSIPGNLREGNADLPPPISLRCTLSMPPGGTYLMNIKWLSVPALALCIAAPATIKAAAQESPLPPSAPQSSATQSQDQYQDRDRDWDRTPDGYRDPQRQGFREGVEAARRDYMNHRHADADDHDVFKRPPVDRQDRGEFREGFKEGYRRAMDHMKHDRDRDRDYDRPQF